MASFSAWVLSIAGICVLSVLIDLILPSGSTNKFVRGVFSFFVVLVIVSPIPTLLKKDYSLDSILSDDNIVIQEEFIFQLNRDRLDDIEKDIIKELKNYGIDGVEVMVSADIFTTNLKIDAVFVDLFNMVITDESEHININEVVITCVLNNVNIEKEKIIINE